MKKIYLVGILSILFIQIAHSQSFTIGLKGNYGIDWLLNSKINENQKLKYTENFCNSGGLSLAWYFNERSYYSSIIPGVNLDILYSNYNQKITGIDSGYVTEGTKLTYLDLPILFRITPEFGPYLEAGGQLSFLLGATGDVTNTRPIQSKSPMTGDLKDKFGKTNISAIIGSGIDIDITEYFSIMLGFRVAYGLTDITSPQSNVNGYEPTHLFAISGIAGLVYTLNYFH